MSAPAIPVRLRWPARVAFASPAATLLLHSRMVPACLLLPLAVAAAAALFVPARMTADALMLVDGAVRAGPDGVRRMVAPWDAARVAANALWPLPVEPTADPAVVRVYASGETGEAAAAALWQVLADVAPPGTNAPPEPDAAANPAREALGEAKRRTGITDLTEDLRQSARRAGELASRIDALQQQAAGAAAAAAAAARVLARQPDTVPDSWETADNAPSDSGRALLLSLMVEREHLVAQYNADFPSVREVDRKIATVKTAIAADARAKRVTVREMRNPANAALADRIAAARVAEEDARAQAREAQGQLAAVRARGAELVRAEPEIQRLQDLAANPVLEPALATPAVSGVQILRPPVISPIPDRGLAMAVLLAGLGAGLALAAGVYTFQRRVFRALLPVDGLELAAFTRLAPPPHRYAMAHAAASQLPPPITQRTLADRPVRLLRR